MMSFSMSSVKAVIMKQAGILLIVLLCLTGCAHVDHYGMQDIPTKYKEIKEGESTAKQVITIMGRPQEVIHYHNSQHLYFYENVTNTYGKRGVFKGRENQRLLVVFDGNDLVVDVRYDEIFSDKLYPEPPKNISKNYANNANQRLMRQSQTRLKNIINNHHQQTFRQQQNFFHRQRQTYHRNTTLSPTRSYRTSPHKTY